jgi:uncharacterized protein HemY
MTMSGKPGSGSLAEAHAVSAALMNDEKWREHERFLRAALRRFPADAELAMRLGATLAPDSPQEARLWILKAIERRGDDPVLLTRAALLLFSLGDIDGAREYAKNAYGEAAKDPESFTETPALALLMGRLALAKGNFYDAERAFRVAFRLEPSADSGAALAELLLRTERPQEALDVVTEALRAQPNAAELHQLKSRLLAERGVS